MRMTPLLLLVLLLHLEKSGAASTGLEIFGRAVDNNTSGNPSHERFYTLQRVTYEEIDNSHFLHYSSREQFPVKF